MIIYYINTILQNIATFYCSLIIARYEVNRLILIHNLYMIKWFTLSFYN